MSQSDPHPGIHREHWIDSTGPVQIDLVRIDLTSGEIALYATKESDKGITTSGSRTLGAQVAINGDAFAVVGYTPRGLAIGDATPWTTTFDTAELPVLHFRRSGERTYGAIEAPREEHRAGRPADGTQGAMSGRPLLVRAGGGGAVRLRRRGHARVHARTAPRGRVSRTATRCGWSWSTAGRPARSG